MLLRRLIQVITPRRTGCSAEKLRHSLVSTRRNISSSYATTIQAGPTEDGSIFDYDYNKAVLYALSVGEHQNMRYLYESQANFAVVPSLAILPSLNAIMESDVHSDALAERNRDFDLTRLLHGEQFVELHQPIPVPSAFTSTEETRFTTSKKVQVLEVLDKGNSTVVITQTGTHNRSGELMFTNQMTSVIMGTGGWGGPRKSSNPLIKHAVMPPEPHRPPDRVVCQETEPHQAILYRLMGDKNPLHIDADFAVLAGYDRPILHGLCTLGFATRHIIHTYSNEAPENCLRIKARFSGVVFPGQTIQTEMWKVAKRIHFQCKVKETGKLAISGGYVDLTDRTTA